MGYPEAQYAIDEILAGIETNQISGIPPRNVDSLTLASRDKSVIITCVPPKDTVIDNQLLCTVAGVRIIRKLASAPKNQEDGTVVADIPVGKTYSKSDNGLTNGLTYYYAAFPYSDHGIYNFNKANIKSVVPSTTRFWGFEQNFSDKQPSSTISYPSDVLNVNYTPMHTNSGTGSVTVGSWGSFLTDVLKNHPAAVGKDGRMTYALNPADYTKKKDGGNSDYNNKSYNGGMFAWINKLWVKEEYKNNGQIRKVTFADRRETGYQPMGFFDMNNKELEGIWIPMGYADTSGRTLIGGTSPGVMQTTDAQHNAVNSFSNRAVFLGGPIMHFLRDLEYMLFKTTDIQNAAGHGNCKAYVSDDSTGVKANANINNGNVVGWYGTSDKKTLNKYFHSQVLGGYSVWIRDPYSLLVNGKLKMSDHYVYDMTGNSLTDTNITYTAASGYYPVNLLSCGGDGKLGSEMKCENTGSSAKGLCDGLWANNTSGVMCGRRLGYVGNDLWDGPAAFNVNDAPSFTHWGVGFAVLLLPPEGYSPTF